MNAPNFEAFRKIWQPKYLDGFVVHSRAFDSLEGNFPIGFLVWDQIKAPMSEITVNALDRHGALVSEKTYLVRPNSKLLNAWIVAPPARGEVTIPLSNALTTRNPRVKRTSTGAIGHLFASNNDMQNAGQGTLIASSIFTGRNGGGLFLLPENIADAAVIFSVRLLTRHTWQNHSDQFLQPSQPLSDIFKSDCLIWSCSTAKILPLGRMVCAGMVGTGR